MNEIINNEQCHDLLIYFNRPEDLKHLKYAEVFNQYNWSYQQPQRQCYTILIEAINKTVYLVKNKDQNSSITRIEMVPIMAGEIWYLRLILLNVPVDSFQEALHDERSFQLAAIALGIVKDKTECLLCFQEACQYSTPPQLRALFVLLTIQGFPTHIIFDEPSNIHLKQMMFEDYLYNNNHNVQLAYNELLNDLSQRFLEENHTLADYGLPEPETLTTELQREKIKYNREEQLLIFNNLNARHPNTPEQQQIFDSVTSGIEQKRTQIIFIQGKGGSGKTTLVKKIIAWTRSRGLICLGCASTALAAKNYEDFTTAHDLFRFPVVDEDDRETNERIHCRLDKDKQRKELLDATDVIPWDEVLSNHMEIFTSAYEIFNGFNGKTVILVGDPLQIGPVVVNGSKNDILQAHLIYSILWSKITIFKLTLNLRLAGALSTNRDTNTIRQQHYANLILDIGKGKMESPYYETIEYIPDTGLHKIKIPNLNYFLNSENNIQNLINIIYPIDLPTSELHKRSIIAGSFNNILYNDLL